MSEINENELTSRLRISRLVKVIKSEERHDESNCNTDKAC